MDCVAVVIADDVTEQEGEEESHVMIFYCHCLSCPVRCHETSHLCTSLLVLQPIDTIEKPSWLMGASPVPSYFQLVMDMAQSSILNEFRLERKDDPLISVRK